MSSMLYIQFDIIPGCVSTIEITRCMNIPYVKLVSLLVPSGKHLLHGV